VPTPAIQNEMVCLQYEALTYGREPDLIFVSKDRSRLPRIRQIPRLSRFSTNPTDSDYRNTVFSSD
jgi:hypothetical protein